MNEHNAAPLLTIGIPTYNRARYLESLLVSLTEHMAGFPHSYEIFIGDNASDDNTTEVVARFADQLPIRYVRHESNIGGGPNWQHLVSNARGTYFCYVADDDGLLGTELARAITVMQALPKAGVAYAPWKLLDLVANKELTPFYRIEEEVMVERGNFAKLLETLLNDHIFPEIAIFRLEVLRAVKPRLSEQSFYAFVHAAEFTQHAQVIFLKDAFYVSVTNYFADHKREQIGNVEAEYAWDRYRGGLEHVLGRALPQITDAQRIEFLQRIERMVAVRMSVAIRLRMQNKRDPVDTYYLAYRLKAMGAEDLLPAPLPALARYAALSFLTSDVEINRDMTELVCVGSFPAEVRQVIEERVQMPVRFAVTAALLGPVSTQTLVFGLNGVRRETLPVECRARFVPEIELMSKFVS